MDKEDKTCLLAINTKGKLLGDLADLGFAPEGYSPIKVTRGLTEMPTSGELESGDPLFFNPPPPPINMGMPEDII